LFILLPGLFANQPECRNSSSHQQRVDQESHNGLPEDAGPAIFSNAEEGEQPGKYASDGYYSGNDSAGKRIAPVSRSYLPFCFCRFKAPAASLFNKRNPKSCPIEIYLIGSLEIQFLTAFIRIRSASPET
jgi:hypothetical protein